MRGRRVFVLANEFQSEILDHIDELVRRKLPVGIGDREEGEHRRIVLLNRERYGERLVVISATAIRAVVTVLVSHSRNESVDESVGRTSTQSPIAAERIVEHGDIRMQCVDTGLPFSVS